MYTNVVSKAPDRKCPLVGVYSVLEYSCNKYSNLIGQLEVHYFYLWTSRSSKEVQYRSASYILNKLESSSNGLYAL